MTTFDYLADLVFHNNRLAMLIDEPSCRDERPRLQCLQLLVTGLEAYLDDLKLGMMVSKTSGKRKKAGVVRSGVNLQEFPNSVDFASLCP